MSKLTFITGISGTPSVESTVRRQRRLVQLRNGGGVRHSYSARARLLQGTSLKFNRIFSLREISVISFFSELRGELNVGNPRLNREIIDRTRVMIKVMLIMMMMMMMILMSFFLSYPTRVVSS